MGWEVRNFGSFVTTSTNGQTCEFAAHNAVQGASHTVPRKPMNSWRQELLFDRCNNFASCGVGNFPCIDLLMRGEVHSSSISVARDKAALHGPILCPVDLFAHQGRQHPP